MFKRKLLCLLLAIGCVAGFPVLASAAEVPCDAAYCFSDADFSADEKEPLAGICILSLPDSRIAAVRQGNHSITWGCNGFDGDSEAG